MNVNLFALPFVYAKSNSRFGEFAQACYSLVYIYIGLHNEQENNLKFKHKKQP